MSWQEDVLNSIDLTKPECRVFWMPRRIGQTLFMLTRLYDEIAQPGIMYIDCETTRDVEIRQNATFLLIDHCQHMSPALHARLLEKVGVIPTIAFGTPMQQMEFRKPDGAIEEFYKCGIGDHGEHTNKIVLKVKL